MGYQETDATWEPIENLTSVTWMVDKFNSQCDQPIVQPIITQQCPEPRDLKVKRKRAENKENTSILN